jgi:Zn-finger nucleic acid-binding protein
VAVQAEVHSPSRPVRRLHGAAVVDLAPRSSPVHDVVMAPTRRKSVTPAPAPKNSDLVAEGARPCPICKKAMQTVRQGKETIDQCAAHGVWLDRFELERMFAGRAVRSGRRLERAVRDAREEGNLGWYLWRMLDPD